MISILYSRQQTMCLLLIIVAADQLTRWTLLFHTQSLNVVLFGYRASIPVFIAIAAVVIERRIPTLGESAGLLLLSGGAILALWDGTVVGSPYASFCCVTGTICHAAMLSFSGLLLSEHIDAVRLTFYTAPVSLALLLPIFLLQEVRYLTYAQVLDSASRSTYVIKLIHVVVVFLAWGVSDGNGPWQYQLCNDCIAR